MKKLLPILILLISINAFSQEKKELATLQPKEASFKLYPNPSTSSDQLFIKFEKNTVVKRIEVFDLFGKSVFLLKPSVTPRSKVTIGELPRGIFLLRIQMNKTVATRRIVVK